MFCFELTLYLILWLMVCRAPAKHNRDSVSLLFHLSLPLTLILLSGVVLLSASVGSADLDSIQQYLSKASQEDNPLLSHSLSALGIVLIVAGIAFRMSTIPVNFYSREHLKTMPFWLSTLFTLISVGAGSTFLILFLNQIAVIHFGYTEQIIFFIALMILATTTGLLLIEKELKVTLILMIMQIVGMFFVLLSVTCWKWRYDLSGGASTSILDRMNEFSPMFFISFLAVMGLACLLDSLSSQQSEIVYQDQLQGLIGDQRLLGSAAILLLTVIMGVPGLASFQLKWQTLLSLFQVHQEQSSQALPTIHLGFLALAVLMLISCTTVAFVCGKFIIKVGFEKPLARHRILTQKRMAFFCYCCLILALLFHLKWVANF